MRGCMCHDSHRLNVPEARWAAASCGHWLPITQANQRWLLWWHFLNLVKTVIATATLLIVSIQANVLQVLVHCFPFLMACNSDRDSTQRVFPANQGACKQYSRGNTGTHFIGPVNENRKTNQNQTRVSPNLLGNPFYATREDCMGRYYLHCISSLTSTAVSNSGPVV